LSGDWTRIFLEKVKESNPWCSLRFKNNHVRSENSRKIHSAVFFRGGAECKRPECNVKVRFVIRKEKGKHVDVTYVGNVCHSSEPGGSDVGNEKKTKQVRRMRKPYGLHEWLHFFYQTINYLKSKDIFNFSPEFYWVVNLRNKPSIVGF